MNPQPPEAFIVEPSFVVPGFPGLDNRRLPPDVVQKPFFEAIPRAEEERNSREEDAKFALLLEQDSKKAYKVHRRAMDAEHASLFEEDLRKTEEGRQG